MRTAYRLPSPAYQRRGVLLLVVLSMLILFVMIAVTYVLVASRQLSIGKSGFTAARTNGIGVDPPKALLDGAMMQAFRGTNNPHSVLGGTMSLLEHYYGGPAGQPVLWGQVGTVTTFPNLATGNSPGPLFQITLPTPAVAPAASPALKNINDSPSQIEGYYEGCLLTMTSGPAAGLSTRIVRYMYPSSGNNSGKYLIRAMTFKSATGAIVPNAGDTFFINGRPFAGTGNGWHWDPVAKTGTLDAKDANGREFALLPNPVFYDPGSSSSTSDYKPVASNTTWAGPVPFGGWGGANIDYSIPDYQNMYMAWVSTTSTSSIPIAVLPSYHRPDLINYWMKTRANITTWDASNVALLRQICLRPNPIDHPNFTGSNPQLSPTNFSTFIIWQAGGGNGTPPWDVDNDGDGRPDSVWIDLGYPVQSTADGRLYKPLFAILCIDLDGRLNINTAGTAEATANTIPQGTFPYAGTTGAGLQLPRGEGFGPSEIDVTSITAASNIAGYSVADFKSLFVGKAGVSFDGRYGTDAASGKPPQAGIPGVPDKLGLLKHFQFPDDNFPASLASLSAYGSPSDMWGRMTVGLDFRGQPYYFKPTRTAYANMWGGELLNSPYDLNLSRDVGNPGTAYQAQTADNPLTVFELERLLRPYDDDSQELPPRLWQLSGMSRIFTAANSTLQTRLQLPRELTTDSWDPPVPSTIYPFKTRQLMGANGVPPEPHTAHHITEMLAAQLVKNNLTVNQANSNIRDLLPEDLIAGLRMNINRPFGFGRDADGNGLVDEPTISELNGTANRGTWWTMGNLYSNLGAGYSNYKNAFLNLTNGRSVTGRARINVDEELRSRQLMARYLYVLARLFITDEFLNSPNNKWFKDDPFDPTIDADPNPYGKKFRASVRRIAQWAVNVVDFMDADSICTPFEYDLYPFSAVDPTAPAQPKDPTNPTRTWCVDGIIADPNAVPAVTSADDGANWRGLVWGCERPELLITETFAFHDRRTEDLDTEQPDMLEGDNHKKTRTTDMNDPDASFDQQLMPRSGFFLELYNPWASNAPFQPGEFYSNPINGGPSNNSGVQLNRMSGGGKSSPVWRLLVVKDNQAAPKVRDPDDQENPLPANLVDRAVYFAPINAANQTIDPSGTIYYSDLQIAPLLPGRYAVVGGSGDDTAPNGIYETTFGRRSDAVEGTRATLKTDSTRRIVLTPSNNPNTNQVVVKNNRTSGADDMPAPPDVQPDIAVVINKPRSLSLTEPKDGYPGAPGSNPAFLTAQGVAYTPSAPGVDGKYNPPFDIPFDNNPVVQTDPDLQSELRLNGINQGFRRVHLQRLANPLLPWNKSTNPYLTIDSMAVPLTKFNGVEKQTDDPAKPDPISGRNPTALVTLERGDETPVSPSKRDLWHYDFALPPSATITPLADATTPPHIFKVQLQHTLGYLNKVYDATPYTSTNAPASSFDIPGQKFYAGTPSGGPFPWLVWNNRPFSNLAELMLVPACRSSELAREFQPIDSITTQTNEYKQDTSGQLTFAGNNVTPKYPYGYLLNFFFGSKPNDPASPVAPNFAQILEYLQVPTPFVGTETVLDPIKFKFDTHIPAPGGPNAGEGSIVQGGSEPEGTAGLHPPFNTVSNYRDPGRVNINTIADPSTGAVWNAIRGASNQQTSTIGGPTFQDVAVSRQGYGSTTTLYQFDNQHPSIFSNPFRAPGGADMVPLPGLAHKPVNASIWRADGADPDANTTGIPLLAKNYPTGGGHVHNESARNPYFYFETMGRFTNKITTRSNVYAVWVTVGYFEVTPWQGSPPDPTVAMKTDAGHPDGYQLGQELGADTGEIERHRGFYIIDRSIPVGFQRGVDNNVNNAVILKRFIE